MVTTSLTEGGLKVDEWVEAGAHPYDSPDTYLFRCGSGAVEFVQIECEMEQLNDYCWLLSEGVAAKRRRLFEEVQQESKDPKADEANSSEQVDFDFSSYILGFEEHELPMWEDTEKFILPATCVVLTYIFIEKSLRSLIDSFQSTVKKTDQKPKQKNGLSKVETYLDFIKHEYFTDIFISEDILKFIKTSQKTRNAFAHGEWSEVRLQVANIDLQILFSAVAKLFKEIEKCYINCESVTS